MSTATIGGWSGRTRYRWRRRVGVLMAFAALAAGLVTTAAPGSAHANLPNGCPDASTDGDFQVNLPGGFFFKSRNKFYPALLVFWVESATPTFNVADSRVVVNNLSTPVTATFTSQQSQTFSISETVTTNIERTVLDTVFSNTVSSTVTESRTTQIGVSTTAEVPPFGRVQGDYGLEAFNVTWTVDAYEVSGGRCWYHYSDRHVVSNVPTIVEGWRVHA